MNQKISYYYIYRGGNLPDGFENKEKSKKLRIKSNVNRRIMGIPEEYDYCIWKIEI